MQAAGAKNRLRYDDPSAVVGLLCKPFLLITTSRQASLHGIHMIQLKGYYRRHWITLSIRCDTTRLAYWSACFSAGSPCISALLPHAALDAAPSSSSREMSTDITHFAIKNKGMKAGPGGRSSVGTCFARSPALPSTSLHP